MGESQGTPTPPAGSFGEELRKEREIRGISIEEISQATKIRKGFLTALEANNFDALPAPVFTRGFVREYARYLGLNPEEMVDRFIYYERASRDGIEELPQPLISNDSAALEKLSESRERGRRILVSVAVITVIVLAAVAGWFFLVRQRSSAPVTASDTAETLQPPPPSIAPSATPLPTPVPTPPEAHRKMTLKLEATEATWIELQADGATVMNGEMKAGEERSFEADDRFVFRTIGNAGGLSLTLDGQSLPPLGASGEVLHDRTYTRPSPDGTDARTSP